MIMSKFKVGELIRCVDASQASGLTVGKTYEVVQTSPEFAWVDDDRGTRFGYYDSRFELVAETGQEPDKSGQEPEFKVGQLIRCKAKADDLTIGFLYEVLSHDPEGDPYVENDEGDSKPYSSKLFQNSQEPWEATPFNADYASTEQSVQSTIDRSMLIYNYLDAKRDFEAAMTSYNEACQAIRDKLKDGERFVYTRYSEAYIVQRDKDGFTVDKIDMV
jgi:hypothetical protein